MAVPGLVMIVLLLASLPLSGALTLNMAVPGLVMIVLLLASLPLSGALTLGWFGLAGLGRAWSGGRFCCDFRCRFGGDGSLCVDGAARGLDLRFSAFRPQKELAADILRVGLLACANSTLMIITVIVVTALVGRYGTAALAGYGLGSRLEIMLVPIAFGVGGGPRCTRGCQSRCPTIRQSPSDCLDRWTGRIWFLLHRCRCGLVLAPELWIGLFSDDAGTAAVARQYLQIAGIGYPVFGMGMALYFASQGTGNMSLQLFAGTVRAIIVVGRRSDGGLCRWCAAAMVVRLRGRRIDHVWGDHCLGRAVWTRLEPGPLLVRIGLNQWLVLFAPSAVHTAAMENWIGHSPYRL